MGARGPVVKFATSIEATMTRDAVDGAGGLKAFGKFTRTFINMAWKLPWERRLMSTSLQEDMVVGPGVVTVEVSLGLGFKPALLFPKTDTRLSV